MANNDVLRLAVLIDADNASAAVAKELLEEVAKYGTPTIKRAYGDWTTPNLGGWKDHLHKYAIQPMQQFAYTKGKNSTDSAFIIDAMDLLYAGNVDGFCLVSSDSDFTRLATRSREAGKVVYGLGERKTPEPFIGRATSSSFSRCSSARRKPRPPCRCRMCPTSGNFSRTPSRKRCATTVGRRCPLLERSSTRITHRSIRGTMASRSSASSCASSPTSR